MMTFDQIKDTYAAYLRSRDVKDTIEWINKGVNEDDRAGQRKDIRFDKDAGRKS